jgi:hypothetical protein
MEQRIQEFLSNSSTTSKELLENLMIEIDGYLTNLSPNQLGIDPELTEKLVHSLGFAMGLLYTNSSSTSKSVLALLRSVLLLSKNEITNQLIVQNAILVSYLLGSSSIQDKFNVTEDLKIYADIWMALKAYHKQLVQLATPNFFEQFKRVTMHHISIKNDSNLAKENSMGRLLIQILLGMVLNLSPESSGLFQLSESGWHIELLELLSHQDTVISSCALGILNVVVRDTTVRKQVFCPANLVSMGNLIIKLVENGTETLFFRKSMFEIIFRSEKEGFFSLDLLKGLASKVNFQTLKVKPIMELVQFFSSTNLPKTHSFYAFEFDEKVLWQLVDLSKTSKSQQDKMYLIYFFKSHSIFIFQNTDSCILKKQLFEKTWMAIIACELEKVLNGAPQNLEFLDTTLQFLQDRLVKLNKEMESLLIQLFSQSFSSEYAVSILLLLDWVPNALMNNQDQACFQNILSRKFPMIALECFQGSSRSIEKITILLQSKKRPYTQWISEWNQTKKIGLGSASGSNLSVPILEVTKHFQAILQMREEEHRQQIDRLVLQCESLSILSKEVETTEPVVQQKTVPVSYSDKMIATIQEVKTQSSKMQMECSQLREQKEVLEISVAQLQTEFQEEVEMKKELLVKVEGLECKLSKNQETVCFLLFWSK